MRVRLVLLLLLAAAALVAVGGATSATSKGEFGVFAEENVAMADNGDTVAVSLEGEFNAATKEASGDGLFVHRNMTGVLVASGTFTLERLVAFQFYGCGVIFGDPLPPEFCGGRALYEVHIAAHPGGNPAITVNFDGLLEVNCEIGYPPPATSEGIKLNVKDAINFNKRISGDNLFVAL